MNAYTPDPLLDEGPYTDYGMNAMHEVVINKNPDVFTLRRMIESAKRWGEEDFVTVFTNILNAKLLLGETARDASYVPLRGSSAALRGERP